jgi:hypothetical protein
MDIVEVRDSRDMGRDPTFKRGRERYIYILTLDHQPESYCRPFADR